MNKAVLNRRSAWLLASTVLVSLCGSAGAQETTDETRLPEISVQGTSYETEGTGSYTTDLISVGEKDARPLREIPQSTTVLTRERLNDGDFTSLDTVLKKTPGVVVLTNDDGRSSLYSRGFEYDTLYFNGLPAPLSSIHGQQPDMAIVDHIEILRGPAGLFGGSGEPGGAINMRLKQAPDRFQGRVSTTLGSWNNRRIEGDVGGPLNDAGTLRGRLVGAFGKSDHFVDHVDNQIRTIYGTLQADITENTTATLSINHQKRDITPFNGLPAIIGGTELLDIDRSTFTGMEWNHFESTITDYIGEIEHRFDDGGHVKASARYSDRSADYLYAFAGSGATANGVISRVNWTARTFEETALALDAHVSKPFELWGKENNLIVGADYRNFSNSWLNLSGGVAGSFDLNNWDPTAIARPSLNFAAGAPTESDLRQYGIYGQWRFKPLDNLTLIGGGRLTWVDLQTLTTDQSIDAEFTPYAGIIYDITDRVSAYASFTQIFQPQTDVTFAGDIVGPRTGRQFEVGLKANLFDDVNASIAYFNLRDNNRAVRDPSNTAYSVAQGQAKLQGLELELTGSLTPNWQVAGGYTYTDTEFVNTTNFQGAEFYTPRHMFQAWTKYNFDERHGILDKAFVGAGVKVFSSFRNLTRTAAGGLSADLKAPGYTVVDLQAGYNFNENLSAVLSVNNVFDEKYYERLGSLPFFNFYGAPRNVNLKLTAQF